MAVSLQTQWTLVASGLVAHADHVLTGEECDRLMTMVDQQIDGDDYDHWMRAIGDRERLETLLEGLAAPRSECRQEILEAAWLMAVVDGERADEELAVLKQVAGRLDVESSQIDGWVKSWTDSQHDYAETAAAALAWVLGGGEPVDEPSRGPIDEFVHTLPTTHDHRESLLTQAAAAHTKETVEPRMAALGRPLQKDLLRRLSVAVDEAEPKEPAQQRLATLSAALDRS